MIHVGTMGWSYDFWRGSFYPKEKKPPKFLGYYATQLDTVEVNSTFYRIPRRQTMEEWKKQTGSSFIFSLKFPSVITHIKMLEGCQEETRVFLDRAGILGNKLGPLLLQFPETFGTEQLPHLKEFLKELPKNHRYVVEIRDKLLLNEKLYSILRQNNVVLAWVDSPFMPTIETVTSDFIYVRWEGDRKQVKGLTGKREVDKSTALKSWAVGLKPFSESNREIFGYFSKYYSGDPTADARDFLAYSKDV